VTAKFDRLQLIERNEWSLAIGPWLPPRYQGTGKGKVANRSRVRPVLGGSTSGGHDHSIRKGPRAAPTMSHADPTLDPERCRLAPARLETGRRWSAFESWDLICKPYGWPQAFIG